MLSESTIQAIIISHGITGSIGLLSGLVSIVSAKGGKLHKRMGKLFTYSMLLTACTALFVCVMPSHFSPFLFVIGIFSSYFVLTGNRALRFKSEAPQFVDYLISGIMTVTGVAMIAYPIVLNGSINIILTVFGLAGLFFSIEDQILYRNAERLKKGWLQMHLGKMMGAYISAVTAFIVVNKIFPGVYGWIAPGVIGGVLIAVWTRKYSK